MTIYESIVMARLLSKPHIFIRPQYSIRDNNGQEWSCPDFIALNFIDKSIYVVEVTTAYSPVSLKGKIVDRENQWNMKLKEQLLNDNIIDEKWVKIFILAFVRESAMKVFIEEFRNSPDVKIFSLEGLGSPWNWNENPFFDT